MIQKIKIDGLNLNLVPMPIRTSRIQWCWSLFPFLTVNTLWGQIWSEKIWTVSLSWSLVPSRIQKLFSFLQFWPDILFLGKFGSKLDLIFTMRNYASILKWTHWQNSLAAAEAPILKIFFQETSPKWSCRRPHSAQE